MVRDAIIRYLKTVDEASVAEIRSAVSSSLQRSVPASSVRSYLRLNEPRTFTRTDRGRYRLNRSANTF
jgi:site-specific DNA-methyltransferase (adenine-specific)